jgi:hypothetical protein
MGLFCILHPPLFWEESGPGEILGGDGFARDCPLSQPVVVNPAIWWIRQEVPHSRRYSGRNRTGEVPGRSGLRSTGWLSPAGKFRFALGSGIELAEAE